MYNIKEIFPEGLTPRNNQEEVIRETIKAIENGKRFIVIEAPTGFGKSMVALSLANYYDSVYIVCSTKQLQDQYIGDFEDYCDKNWRIMKGKSNYKCNSKKNCTCEDGLCKDMKDNIDICEKYHSKTCEWLNKEGNSCDNCKYPKNYCDKGTNTAEIIPNHDYLCDYWRARSYFIGSEIGILNYDMLFLDNIGSGLYKNIHKDVIIFDEAHNIDNKLLRFFSTNIKYKNYNFLSIIKYNDYINNYKEGNSIKNYLETLNNRISTDINYNLESEEKKKAVSLNIKINNILQYIREHGESNLLVEFDEDYFKVEPLELHNGKSFIEKSNSTAFVFMSATFENYKEYFKEIGIKPSEIVYIPGNSDFTPRKNNPIIPRYKNGTEYRINNKNCYNPNSKAMKELYHNIQSTLDEYPEDRGLIHTRNKRLKYYIENNITDNRLVFYNDFNKKEVVDNFKDNIIHNEVLVTYSHTEGLDLPGDKCRFQILCKVPFPYRDKRTEIKMKKNNDWYLLQTIRTLTQTVGRGYRYKEDYCDNYILDNNYQWLVSNRNAKKLKHQTRW